MECDAIVHTVDGKWGAIEIKLGDGVDVINEAAKALLKFESVVKHRENAKTELFEGLVWYCKTSLSSQRWGVRGADWVFEAVDAELLLCGNTCAGFVTASFWSLRVLRFKKGFSILFCDFVWSV